jgi:hypothetical protein
MEAVEERPVVDRDRRAGVAASEARLEVPEITGEPGRIEPEVVAGAQHRVVAQCGAEEVERVAEEVAGVGGVALGPKRGHQAVAAHGARVLNREEGQQCDALAQRRAASDRSIGTLEDSGAEQPKCECHKDLRATTRARRRCDGLPLV